MTFFILNDHDIRHSFDCIKTFFNYHYAMKSQNIHKMFYQKMDSLILNLSLDSS